MQVYAGRPVRIYFTVPQVVRESECVQQRVVSHVPHLHRLVSRARDALGRVCAEGETVNPGTVCGFCTAVELAFEAAVLTVVDEGLKSEKRHQRKSHVSMQEPGG